MANRPLTHRQRLEFCLNGDVPDRIPVALWRHFPVDDQTPEGLAGATADFQRRFDFDLIKVTPSSSYCLRDWGSQDRWTGDPEGTRIFEKFIIHQPDDWSSLSFLNPRRGALSDMLTTLRILVSEFSPQVPVIQTIFSPMAQAKNLVSKDKLLTHMRCFPDALQVGLERITQSTIRFLEEAVKIGIDGVFFAVQHAQSSLLTWEEFETFCKPYDLRVLEVANRLWLNMGHIHGEDIMFDMVAKYPVSILNWHDQHTPPSLAAARSRFNGAVCGGLDRIDTMVLGTPHKVIEEAKAAIQATGGKRFILGTGCVLPITAPFGNIQAARQIVTSADLP